jgi:hypothetical protein
MRNISPQNSHHISWILGVTWSGLESIMITIEKTANQITHNPLDNAHNLRNIRQTVQDNIDDASNYTT